MTDPLPPDLIETPPRDAEPAADAPPCATQQVAPDAGGPDVVVPPPETREQVVCAPADGSAQPEAEQRSPKRQRTGSPPAATVPTVPASTQGPFSADGSRPVLARRSSRGLILSGGTKPVPGFEEQGVCVATSCGKKLPKTQSWCFVPLIFSALRAVPERLRREDTSTPAQIAGAQPIWSALFSHWALWRDELRRAIDGYGQLRFEEDFLPRGNGGAKPWTTSLVFGEPREWGRLPHPPGRSQDTVLNLLPCDTQNQIFASVMALTQF